MVEEGQKIRARTSPPPAPMPERKRFFYVRCSLRLALAGEAEEGEEWVQEWQDLPLDGNLEENNANISKAC